jgi:hypothetical protein
MTSPNGITWTNRVSSNESNSWGSITWSPELGIFVAVAGSGTNRVMTSSNGTTWTGRTSSNETNQWNSVTWSPELGIFVAVALSGTNRVMTSPDGVNWTGRTSSNESNQWRSVTWSPELGIFVAVSSTGTNRIMISYNGINWTGVASSNEANLWQSVAWSSGLGMFVAVADTGGNKVMTLDCKTPLKITGDSQVVGRFTASSIQAGEDAPITKKKKLTGTTASTQGGSTGVAHGLTVSKILSCKVLINYYLSELIETGYWESGYECGMSVNETTVTVTNAVSPRSSQMLNKPFKILIEYEV